MGACYVDMERQRENVAYATYAQFKDNSVKLMAPKATSDVKIKSTIYPPPQAEDIRMVRFCTILKQIIVYVRSGILYFYRLEQGTSVMVREIFTAELRDTDNQLIDQQVSSFEIGCIEPPRYDCRNAFKQQGIKRQKTYNDKKEKRAKQKIKAKKATFANKKDDSESVVADSTVSDSTSLLETDPEENEVAPEDMWMILGCHRGLVVIYNIHKFEIPQCRYDVCRAEITMIREVYPLKLHLFYDKSHILTLAELSPTGVKIMHQVNIIREIFDLLVFQSSIYLAFETGDIDFWEVQNLKENEMLQRN